MGRATQRSIEILELIAKEEGRWSHAEIARRLDIPKSSLTDLLRDLIRERYLELGRDGEHLIGPSVLMLSRAYLQRMDVVSASRDILSALCRHADEAASIAVRQGIEIVVVAQERPIKPMVAAMTLGDRAPIVATAAGKAILAFLDEAVVATIVEQSSQVGMALPRPRSRSELSRELQHIRAGKLATNDNEWMDGLSAIALPIGSADGPIASIAVAAPTSRMTDEWRAAVEPHLRHAARDLTLRMGGPSFKSA